MNPVRHSDCSVWRGSKITMEKIVMSNGVNKKVICAMSGGVDSSVAAALLKKQGYDVIGLFLNMHQNFNSEDAEKVAKKLNIPLKILDVRKEFKKRVVDYLIREYKEGKTPNPCVECNRWIKFKFLMEKAMALKADFIATGHYARLRREFPISNFQFPIKLLKAKDKHKDQSYFLWTLTQDWLRRILFPIGDYTKKEVKEMAKKWGLPIFGKRESQEICFVNTNLHKFLETRIHTKKGSIITVKGEKVGEHEGLAFYTIGQRKGIGVGGIGPFYVVDKDFKNNTLIVAKSEYAPELYKKEMLVEKVNWTRLDSQRPALAQRADARQGFRCRVKIRYLHSAVPATIFKIQNSRFKIKFDKKQRAITPGQSAVFYKRSEILGGGVII